MAEAAGTKNTPVLENVFPMARVQRLEHHNLNAVLIHVMEDGSLRLSIAITDRTLEGRLHNVANEIMRHGIAP